MGDRPLPWFFAPPAGPPPWPGIVLVHENMGLTRQILHTCERLAGEGYAVLAPDLYGRFWGEGPVGLERPYEHTTIPAMTEDLAEMVPRLRELGASRVGLVGFCMGGTVGYACATGPRGGELACSAVFYAYGVAQNLGTPAAPFLGLYAGRDEFIPPEDVDAVVAHHHGQVVMYPESGHGFMREGSRSYEPENASDAWARLLTFLDEHLRDPLAG